MTAAPLVEGAPDHELTRSPAAAAVGRLARESGLLLASFEHRVALPLPAAWAPEDRPDLGEPPAWQAGVLPEAKYQAFRHDLLVGSFHPGHRAKWTAHELCHGLVGFAWRPGATRLFHAAAARLAEVLPVALWYFLDEAGLARCDDHAGQGPLFGAFCARCERAAAGGPRAAEPADARWLAEGEAFVERELDAVRATVERGRPVPHRLATLDLASDGLAYASAHADRLASPAFHRFAEAFFPPGAGLHPGLDALEARVREVLGALLGRSEARPLRGDRGRWAAQDVAWRLLVVREETEGEAAEALDGLVDGLAARPDDAGLLAAAEGYRALHAEYVLPDPEDVFAVGYDLGSGLGRSARQVGEGLATACPRTLDALGPAAADHVRAFTAADGPRREPLGRRFAAWLAEVAPGPAAELARLEAALVHAAPPDPLAASLGPADAADGRVRLAEGAELLRLAWDVLEAPDARAALETGPVDVVVLRRPDGDVHLVEVDAPVAEALARLAGGPLSREALALDDAAAAALLAVGVVTPAAWKA